MSAGVGAGVRLVWGLGARSAGIAAVLTDRDCWGFCRRESVIQSWAIEDFVFFTE